MAVVTSAPDPMQTISVGHWRPILGDAPHELLASAAFVIIREVCSSDGELVPHVLLHTTDRRTYMKGVSSYFGLDDSFSSLTEFRRLRGIQFLQGAFSKDARCPFIVLLGPGGKVWTVGCNDRSQLGHHNLQDQIELCMVPGVFNIKDIAVGAGHSLVVTKMSQVYAWGDNTFGQIGIGSVVRVVERPTRVFEGRDEKGYMAPLQIKQIAASWYRSLLLMQTGKLYIWGNSQNNKPVLFNALDFHSHRFIHISCGKDHCLALSADGRVCVWGRNSNRQLGLGHKLDVETPKVVDIAGSVASVLAVGDTSLVRTYHGDLFVWGRHLSEDICYPLKTEMFPHPRDVLAYGDEIDSGGSVTLAFDMLGRDDDDGQGSDAIEAHRKKIASLRSGSDTIEALGKEIASLRSGSDTIETLRKEIASLRSGSDTIETLRKEIASLRSGTDTIATLRKEIASLRSGTDTIATLRKEIASLRSGSDTIDTLRMEIGSLRSGSDTIESLRKEIASLRSGSDTIESLRKEIASLKSGSDTIDTLRKEIASLRSGSSSNETVRWEIACLRSECKKNYEALEKNHEALQKNYQQSQKETADLKTKFKSVQLDYDNLSVQHKELQSKYEKEAAETKKIIAQLQDLSSDKEAGRAGTDVQFSRKLKILEETLDEMLNVCDVIGTEQRSMKAKMTSLQVQMDSVGVSRPATVRQSIAGLRRKLHTRAADTMPHKKESSPLRQNPGDTAIAAATTPTRRDVDREQHLEDSDCDSDCTYVSL